MKRTGEIVLGVIGAVVYGFFALLGAGMIWLQNNSGLLQDVMEDPANQQLNIEQADLDMVIEMMGSSGRLFLIMSIIAIILGIIAIVFIKGNKKPKVAGILFIATAGIITLVSFGLGFFGGIFYMIAGIMCLVRKPKQEIEA
ncbi:DUF4064 domain-containing protein [Aquibacillus sediminis]|uniref:DUF4064 domain-containing protein n=1 Tax=Aquibacillus sediminis TaxID=2574734 RepID=UPI00110922D0|nr:DUF4064 domain-containing protein [Aquibacillus sediminis]